MNPDKVKALLFDVFGTVVDWRGSVIQEGEALGREKGLRVDWPAFADEWRREGYTRAIERIRQGESPWARVDALHRRKLDELLAKHGVNSLSASEIDHFNRVWHRLSPWPDSVAGLARLRTRFIISPLSNGDFALLTDMAKHSKLPWDCILSGELFRSFKPDPLVYQGAAALLDLRPDEVLMVAAHGGDLRGSRAAGLNTAYVHRPREFGPDRPSEPESDQGFDIVASDFLDLARQLGV
jgi:2-haloacid dehalogenase